jgi:hypothetical protein
MTDSSLGPRTSKLPPAVTGIDLTRFDSEAWPQREGHVGIDPQNEDQYAVVFDPTSGKTLLMLSSGN